MKVAVVKETAPRRAAGCPRSGDDRAVARRRARGDRRVGRRRRCLVRGRGLCRALAPLWSAAMSCWPRRIVILTVGLPDEQILAGLRSGQAILGMLNPLAEPALAGQLAARGVTVISLDGLPRTLPKAQADGRAVVAGQRGWLQGGAGGRRPRTAGSSRCSITAGGHRAARPRAHPGAPGWLACRRSAPRGGSAPWCPHTTSGQETKTEVESLGWRVHRAHLGGQRGRRGRLRPRSDRWRNGRRSRLSWPGTSRGTT